MRCGYLFIAAVLAGCITPVDDSQNFAPQQLVVIVEAEPTVMGRGEALSIRLTVRNESNAEIVRHFSSGCIYGFSLWNDRGEIVAPPPPMCTMNAPTVKYAAGEEFSREFTWVWDDPGMPPGVYLLVAGLGPRGEQESSPAIEVRLQ